MVNQLKNAPKLTKGQSTIESMAIFIVIILIFGGIFNVWIWANKQIVNRQILYNKSRVEAGTSRRDYQLVWPVQKHGEVEELEEGKVIVYP